MKAPLYVLEKKVAGKWASRRFFCISDVRVALVDDPDLRVRRIKTKAEALEMFEGHCLGDIIERNANKYEWVEE